MKRAHFLLLLIVITALTGCSTSYVKIDETQKMAENLNSPYKKVLVIGITSPKHFRQSFENVFADSLQRHGVAAVASHKYIEDLRHADQQQVSKAARDAGADAVIISRVLSKSEHTGYNLATGHAEYRVVSKTTTTENSSTTVTMAGAGYVAGEVDQAGAFLVTHLFNTVSAQRVWSAKSHAAGVATDKMDVCWKLSFALAKALGEDQMIKVTSSDAKMPSL